MEVRRNGTRKGRPPGEVAKNRYGPRSPPSNSQAAAKDRPLADTATSPASRLSHRENARPPTLSPEASLSPRSEAARNPMHAFQMPLRPGEQSRGARSPMLVSDVGEKRFRRALLSGVLKSHFLLKFALFASSELTLLARVNLEIQLVPRISVRRCWSCRVVRSCTKQRWTLPL